MTPADREARQSVIMSLYGLQKTLLTARGASRALLQQADGIKQDLARGGAQVDSLLKRVTQTDAELDRLMSLAGSIARNIESLNAAPLADQRQQAAWAFADASRAITMLNRTTQTDLPALYSQHGGGARPRTAARVALPTNAITTTRSP